MSEIARSPVFRAGVDLFKRVLHVHAVVHPGHVELSKALAPKTFYAWCAQLPPGCAVSSQSHGSQAIGTGLTSRAGREAAPLPFGPIDGRCDAFPSS